MNKLRIALPIIASMYLFMSAPVALADSSASAKAAAAAEESAKAAQAAAEAARAAKERDMRKNEEGLRKNQKEWGDAVNWGKNAGTEVWEGAKSVWNSLPGNRPAYNPLNDPAWVNCTRSLADGHHNLTESVLRELNADRISVDQLDTLKVGLDRVAAQFPSIRELKMTTEVCNHQWQPVIKLIRSNLNEAVKLYANGVAQARVCSMQLLADTKAFDAIRQSYMNAPALERLRQRTALDTELKADISQVNDADRIARAAKVQPFIHEIECSKLKTVLAASKVKLDTFQKEAAAAAACRANMDPEYLAFTSMVGDLRKFTPYIEDVPNRVLPLAAVAADIQKTTTLANADDFVSAAECGVARTTMANSMTSMKPLLAEADFNRKSEAQANACLREADTANGDAGNAISKAMKTAGDNRPLFEALRQLEQRRSAAGDAGSKSPRTVARCMTYKAALASIVQDLAKAGSIDAKAPLAPPPADPRLTACIDAAKAANDRLLETLATARRDGKVDKSEEGQVRGIESVALRRRTQLADASHPPTDCQAMSGQITNDQIQIARIAASDPNAPKVAECRVAAQGVITDTLAELAKARTDGRIDPTEVATGNTIASGLNAMRLQLENLQLTLADCQQKAADVAHFKGMFTGLIINPTPVNGDMETVKSISTLAPRVQNGIDRVTAGLRKLDECVNRVPAMQRVALFTTVSANRLSGAALQARLALLVPLKSDHAIDPPRYVGARANLNQLESDIIAFETKVSQFCAGPK